MQSFLHLSYRHYSPLFHNWKLRLLYNIIMTDLRLQIEPGVIPTNKDINTHFTQQIQEIGIQLHPNSKSDYQEIVRILNVYLSYPDSELAERHRNSNKLGELDSKIKKERNLRETFIRVDNEICNCCGFFVQKEEISACQRKLLEINSFGSSTLVFFQTFINIAILLAVMVVIYSIFAFTTNITTAYDNNYLNSKNGTLDYLSISLGAKVNSYNANQGNSATFYLVSSWLGVPMLVIWFLLLIRMKKGIRKIENQEKRYMSVADFSVVIEKMPTGLTKEEVQRMMDEYLKRIAPTDIEFKQLKIQKYNEAKPFYFNEEEFNDAELEAIHKRLKEIKDEMKGWIEERLEFDDFSSTHEYRQLRIKELNQVREQIHKKNEEIVRRIIQKLQERDKQTKTFVFITFETIQQRDFFLSYNSNNILRKIKDAFPCFDKSLKFSVTKDNKQFTSIVIEAAPQPEDINWGNIGFGQCESLWRKFATFIATLIMLGISFVIVYALSTVQNRSASERFVSILISLVISLINIIIIKVIQNMTVVEKIYTNNNYQISLAIKSIFAQLLNSIFIPIIVNVYIKDYNIYGESGLTEDIFILAIANSFVAPLVRLIDPYYIFTYLRYNYYNRPLNKMTMSQYQLNYYAEKPEYEIGIQYIYIISNFVFICFFVSLQPVIPLFGLLGLLLMYWIEKYAVLHKSQRPVPGVDTISVTMYQMVYLGAVAYALGSLTWSNFLKHESFRNSLVPNLISAGLGLLIFIFPYESTVSYKENANSKMTYDSRRIYFPAEYDRLNPVTKKEGVKEYREFLMRKKEEIDGLGEDQKNIFAAQLANLTKNNFYKANNIKNDFFRNNEVSNAINQIFQNESKNVMDPKLLRSFLDPHGYEEDRNMALYTSALQMRNPNPFGVTQVNINHNNNINNSLIRTDNPNNNDMRISTQQIIDENIKNVYKSNLFLGDLGLASHLNNSKHSDRK